MKYLIIIFSSIILIGCEKADNDRRAYFSANFSDVNGNPLADAEVSIFSRALDDDGTYEFPGGSILPRFGEEFILARGTTDDEGKIVLNSLVNSDLATLISFDKRELEPYVVRVDFSTDTDYSAVIPQVIAKQRALATINLINVSGQSEPIEFETFASSNLCAEYWNGQEFIIDPNCQPNTRQFLINPMGPNQSIDLFLRFPSEIIVRYNVDGRDEEIVLELNSNMQEYDIRY